MDGVLYPGYIVRTREIIVPPPVPVVANGSRKYYTLSTSLPIFEPSKVSNTRGHAHHLVETTCVDACYHIKEVELFDDFFSSG